MKSEDNSMNAIGDYLSLLQLKYDCETICSLIKHLQHDGVAAFGIIPYISLTAASTLELLHSSGNEISLEPEVLQIHDVRLKLKVFENGYSKSKRMIVNIDYLQDQVFKNMLKFDFMRSWNMHYNLGIYTDVHKRVVGNTQYGYYMLQENRFLKKRLEEVATAYSVTPEKFDLSEQTKKDSYEYAYKCGQVIGSMQSALADFDTHVSIATKDNGIDYFYADYNTNVKSSLFPTGDDGKATMLYLLHSLSTINFLLYVLNGYEKDDYGWWLKINYVAYYYTIHKLRDLQQHLIQNKLLTSSISDYFTSIGLDNAKYLNKTFRNYVMHSRLIDKNGKMLIESENLDKAKPLFGLVETCFDGMSYYELKQSIISETVKISNILSTWLGIQNLNISPLKD